MIFIDLTKAVKNVNSLGKILTISTGFSQPQSADKLTIHSLLNFVNLLFLKVHSPVWESASATIRVSSIFVWRFAPNVCFIKNGLHNEGFEPTIFQLWALFYNHSAWTPRLLNVDQLQNQSKQDFILLILEKTCQDGDWCKKELLVSTEAL